EDLPLILAYQSMFSSVGTTLGPVLGGFLTQYLSWRWCFYVNLIIGTVAFVCNVLWLPKIPCIKEPQFDLLGGLGLLVGLLGLVFGITRLEYSWQLGAGVIVASIIVLGLTVMWELRHPCAILPARILR
ncbi:major facilitator superfamily protein, partial [Kipferlia bialata]